MTITSRTVTLCLILIVLGWSLVFSQVGADKRPTTAPKTSAPKTQPKRTSTRPTSRSTQRSRSKSSAGTANNDVPTDAADWETINNSTNPEDFRTYLKKYPYSNYADRARNQLKALEESSRLNAARAATVVKTQMGMDLVYVPAGSFMMGSENGSDDEKPVHQVTIREGFYMGRYEVTQAQWQQVMGDNPSAFKNCDQCPVENVNWDDAQRFISKMNARDASFTYRLPTEAEWEYACRAGTIGDYVGDLNDMAWYSSNSGDKTHPVGTKQPNAFGLYDMHGNVWEWCEDWYHENYSGAPIDGIAWNTGGPGARVTMGSKVSVVRGGSWVNYASNVRSAAREKRPTESLGSQFFGNVIGLRVVAVPRRR